MLPDAQASEGAKKANQGNTGRNRQRTAKKNSGEKSPLFDTKNQTILAIHSGRTRHRNNWRPHCYSVFLKVIIATTTF
jgi:hypothetical protein